MKLCIDFLRQIEQERGWSRFRIGKELGLSKARIYQLFDNGGTYNDETAIKVAQILELNPEHVMAAAHLEREKHPEVQAIWKGLLDKISEGFEVLISRATPRRTRLPAW